MTTKIVCQHNNRTKQKQKRREMVLTGGKFHKSVDKSHPSVCVHLHEEKRPALSKAKGDRTSFSLRQKAINKVIA